jgi:hypothetical protein
MEKQCNLSERGEEILLMGVMGGGGERLKSEDGPRDSAKSARLEAARDKNCPASLSTLKSWRPQKTGQ